ncbi:MAG: SdpI family protein [Caldisericaceae bacterium]
MKSQYWGGDAMNWHIYYAVIYLVFMVLFYGTGKVKRNAVYGIRFRTTLADDGVWEATNTRAAQIMPVTCAVFFTLEMLLLLYNYPTVYATSLFMIFALVILLVTLYLYVYSRNLLKEKGKKPVDILEVRIPGFLIYLMIFASFLTFVMGILSTLVKPNPYIGVRIGKTLQDITTWKKVNVFSGAGFAIIGVVFTYQFLRYIKGVDVDSRRKFWNDFILFTLLLLVWSAISIIYAFLV